MKSTDTTVSSLLNVQPMEVKVTTSSGTKTKTTVKASDPLAMNGALS